MRQRSKTKRVRRALGIALAVSALVAPSAQGGHEDFGVKVAGGMINHRSDAGRLDDAAQLSPDSRVVEFRTATTSPAPISVAGGNGFHWGDAGVGAGGMFALVVLLAGAGTLLARHNQGRLASH